MMRRKRPWILSRPALVSVGEPAFPTTLLAPWWEHSYTRARRVLYRLDACPVAGRAFTLGWI